MGEKKRSQSMQRKNTRSTAISGKQSLSIDRLRRYVRMHAQKWLENPNVTSVGIGLKQSNGEITQDLSIQFTVAKKVETAELEEIGSDPIPNSIDIDGIAVPTDVLGRKFSPSFNTVALGSKDIRSSRVEVLQPGVSIGGLETKGGTLGAILQDRRSRKPVLLSNWHVLQGIHGNIGNPVVQPGRHDDNRAEGNEVGNLMRSHLGAAGDCAISSLSGRKYTPEILGIGLSIDSIGDPMLGDKVIKSGRTTGVTHGIVTRIEVNARMDYGQNQHAFVGGFEIGPDRSSPALDGEISRKGDSGAAWLAKDRKGKPTGTMVGIHFAGDADYTVSEFALACYAKSVTTALEIDPLPKHLVGHVKAQGISDLQLGFDREFLNFPIGIPTFKNSHQSDLARLENESEIRYCHFSVWLSKKRKYPLCVAWNIDGNNFKRLNRVSFRTDRRGDLESFQLTNDIYKNNPFDKGHIARRADLCWGENRDEARQGNYDSFYYTNIVPQHEAFNQSDNTEADPEGGTWGRLENTILDTKNPHRLRVSLMAGPVFGTNDRVFKQDGQQCLIPDQFWKLVAYTDDSDSKEKCYGFLLTQPNLIRGLTSPQGLDLEPWLWARITLHDLEQLTGVKIPQELHSREAGFVAPQFLDSGPNIKVLNSPEEYFE